MRERLDSPARGITRHGFVGDLAALGLGTLAPSVSKGASATVAMWAGAVPGATPGVGFILSHEQFPGPTLVEFSIAASAAGFDTL